MRPFVSTSFSTRWLAWLLQRVTFLTHVVCVMLATLGPIFSPRLVFVVVVAVHVVFGLCQIRTAYGLWACWRGARAHSRRDWKAYWKTRKEELEREGESARCAGQGHVLDLHRVEHIILVPAYKEELYTLREVSAYLTSYETEKADGMYIMFN
jgi:hypothetical protein